jgi:hypothetical protein
MLFSFFPQGLATFLMYARHCKRSREEHPSEGLTPFLPILTGGVLEERIFA